MASVSDFGMGIDAGGNPSERTANRRTDRLRRGNSLHDFHAVDISMKTWQRKVSSRDQTAISVLRAENVRLRSDLSVLRAAAWELHCAFWQKLSKGAIENERRGEIAAKRWLEIQRILAATTNEQ